MKAKPKAIKTWGGHPYKEKSLQGKRSSDDFNSSQRREFGSGLYEVQESSSICSSALEVEMFIYSGLIIHDQSPFKTFL